MTSQDLMESCHRAYMAAIDAEIAVPFRDLPHKIKQNWKATVEALGELPMEWFRQREGRSYKELGLMLATQFFSFQTPSDPLIVLAWEAIARHLARLICGETTGEFDLEALELNWGHYVKEKLQEIHHG